ncbi:hypothetical protein LC040_01690 [Bacillus tianshenii]|nr:hypothetical protein LC040_01690 [Bacillus tianshenii]
MHNNQHNMQMPYTQYTAPQAQQPNMYDYCKKNMLKMMMVQMNDGTMYEGIIEDVDRDYVYMLVPSGEMKPENRELAEEELVEEDTRQFGLGGFPFGAGGLGGFGGYSGYGGYPFGRYPRRFRRFRHYRFPFYGIGGFFHPFFY